MVPIGAIAGALAASQQHQPTKARRIGSHYVGQARVGPRVVLGILWMFLWMLTPVGLFAPRADVVLMTLVCDGLLVALALLSCTAQSAHLIFDDDHVESISLWRRRPRALSYGNLVKVSAYFTNDFIVLRDRSGVVVRFGREGGVTLASVVLKRLPDGATVSARARRLLTTWAAAEAQ